ncbi:MAG: Bro-N domain-containing protein [Selenomonadaceae bacterium]|nr:Bro-N domain-containing protein [Selenomonadaceae bacterium]
MSAKTLQTALGYTNPRKALKDHVPDKFKKDGVTIRDSIGREQKPVLINRPEVIQFKTTRVGHNLRAYHQHCSKRLRHYQRSA